MICDIFNLLKPTGYVMHRQFNLLRPTGYVMHQQFNLLKPTGYVIRQQFNLLKPTGYVMHQQSDLCHLQHQLIGFYNRVEKCLLRGTNWVFK